MEFYSITWPELHRLCFLQYKKIKSSGQKFDLIIAVSRGGLVIARILSDFLTLPIAAFTIESYETIGKKKEEKITYELKTDLTGKNILLVDEICDTGKTLKRSIKYLKSLNANKITSCCLILKDKAIIKPDFYLKTINKWIIFPYEIKESIKEITKLFNLQDKNILKKQFIDYGFDKNQINHFLNETSK